VQNADIAALWDYDTFNAGFIVVRPSPLTRLVYQMTQEISNRTHLTDQRALNEAIRIMQIHTGERVLRVNALDKTRFLNGYLYFWKYARKLGEVCDGNKRPNKPALCPLVVHNNYITGKQAKIYRFREHLMWNYDGADRYYTSETRKYLTYTNPKPTTNFTREVMERQMSALKTALAIGHLLNRVVILPIFHCDQPTVHWLCHLESVADVATFDSCFSGRYRENSFLRHRKVPGSVKHGVVHRQFRLNAKDPMSDYVLVSQRSIDVMRLLNDVRVSAKVLNISGLDRIKIDINDGAFDREFISNLKSGIKLI